MEGQSVAALDNGMHAGSYIGVVVAILAHVADVQHKQACTLQRVGISTGRQTASWHTST